MCTPQMDRSEMFIELYREEKKEEGDRGGQEDTYWTEKETKPCITSPHSPPRPRTKSAAGPRLVGKGTGLSPHQLRPALPRLQASLLLKFLAGGTYS